MKWNDDNTISIIPPGKPKKITGTRFGAVLGANPWSTPFETWCAITRTYEKPFVDTIYTTAGKIIEPKQAAYMQDKYFWKYIKYPSDAYGKNYFEKTRGDFFPDSPIFGGMWDYIMEDSNGNPEAVLEMKTTKRAEDWVDDIPEYYALQAALYAYLLNLDDVYMVCTVLEEKDYENPEKFEVTQDNTFIKFFKVSERYPNFEKIIKTAEKWWKDHIEGGISPKFDETNDAEILKILRANHVNPETDLQILMAEAEELQDKLSGSQKETEEIEKRLKVLKDMIKEISLEQFRDGDKQVILHGGKYDWITSRTVSKKIDEDAMKADGILDKYKTKESVVYKLNFKRKEDN